MNYFAKAADVLEGQGHCKFALRNEFGAHCAVGALLVAVGVADVKPYGGSMISQEQSAQMLDLANEAAEHLYQNGRLPYGYDLVYWNNEPERTGKEVVALFRELAEPRAADIGEEDPRVIEFEPFPETVPVEPTPAPEPVPA